MKHLLILLTAGFLLVSSAAAVQQSDSEIKKDFESRYGALLKAIDAASTLDDIKKVKTDIDDFEKEFTPHKDFLDKALYPENFSKTLETLRTRVKYSEDKTAAVETQTARVGELETQIKTLNEQVEKLSTENSAILTQIHALEADRVKDKKQIEQLQGLVTKLQKNIADRDRMIFNIADSLFLQFDKPTMTPADERQKMIAFEKNNILSSVKRAIEDNMTFLKSTSLSGEDVARLKDEQQKFAGHWKGVGSKLASMYLTSKEKSHQVPMIDSMIVEWGRHAESAFWKALNEEFTRHHLTVPTFSDGDGFYENVSRFIDNQTNNVDNLKEDTRYGIYLTFADTVWDRRIDPVWLPLLKKDNLITENRISDIKARMDVWKAKVKPSNYILYVVLVGLVVIITLIVFARMNKVKTPPSPPAVA
jgi:outer membrane murein-binding lipoprotein Lpp